MSCDKNDLRFSVCNYSYTVVIWGQKKSVLVLYEANRQYDFVTHLPGALGQYILNIRRRRSGTLTHVLIRLRTLIYFEPHEYFVLAVVESQIHEGNKKWESFYGVGLETEIRSLACFLRLRLKL